MTMISITEEILSPLQIINPALVIPDNVSLPFSFLFFFYGEAFLGRVRRKIR